MTKSLSTLCLLTISATALMAHPGHDMVGLDAGLTHILSNGDHVIAALAIVLLVFGVPVLIRRMVRRSGRRDEGS